MGRRASTRDIGFGFGEPTRIDLQGAASGTVLMPGDENWKERTLCTNSFGQGIAVTPLQMLTAVNAIANDGLMMQPHVVYQIVEGDRVYTTQPSPMGPDFGPDGRMVRRHDDPGGAAEQPQAQVPAYRRGQRRHGESPIPRWLRRRCSIATLWGSSRRRPQGVGADQARPGPMNTGDTTAARVRPSGRAAGGWTWRFAGRRRLEIAAMGGDLTAVVH
jgi:hypothetical protein